MRGERGFGMLHQRRLVGLFVVLFATLVLAGVASANARMNADATPTGAPKWLTYPSCSATASTLTCTGKATGIARPFNNSAGVGLSPLQAGVAGSIHYICSDPFFDGYEAGYQSDYIGTVQIKNGAAFTVTVTPNATPSNLLALFSCLGVWTRDPSYHEVSIDIGWGFGSGREAVALTGPVGGVSAP
jgi:hypothetical protein